MKSMDQSQNRLSQAEREHVGRSVQEISAALTGARSLVVGLVSLSIRGPRHEGDEILMVIRGLDQDGQPVVAFHSGYTLGDAIRGVAGRLNNGSLRWREDEYAQQ